MWLAVDVWLCTASIFNLCAISVDRYLAISRPFRYPQLMSPSRARLLIVVVWILSFVICFPPLIGWNDPEHDWKTPPPLSSDNEGRGEGDASTTGESSPVTSPRRISAAEEEGLDPSDSKLTLVRGGGAGHHHHRPVCTLTSEPGYVIYSACGSFWVPMVIMVIFYWKIYKTAVSATAAFRRGFIEKKGACLPNSPSDGALTLRVHRGSRVSSRHHSNGCISELLLPQATAVSMRLSRRSFNSCSQLPMVHEGYDSMSSNRLPDVLRTTAEKQKTPRTTIPRIVITSTSSCDVIGGGGGDGRAPDNYVTDDDVTTTTSGVCSGSRKNSSFLGNSNSNGEHNNFSSSADKRSSLVSLKQSTLNLVSQLRNLNREKKAAKTVGVIVGCFIVCWAPFFTVYLVGAFCARCTPPAMLFHVFFWLGYCNSAVNPFVYGLCSREFRYAFKKLLRCRCERQPRSASSSTDANGGRLSKVFRGMKLQIVTRHDTQHDNYTM